MENRPFVTRVFSRIARHPFITATCLVAAAACSAYYMYITPATYQADTSLEVPAGNSGNTTITLLATQTASPVTEEITNVPFLTQALTGRVPMVRTYVEQDFRKEETRYRFPYDITYRQLNKHFSEQAYTLTPLDNNSFRLDSKMDGLSRSKTGQFGTELIDRDLAITITPKKYKPYYRDPLLTATTWSFNIQSPAAAARELTSQPGALEVSATNGVISISCSNETPERAREIAEAITGSYLNPGMQPSGNPGEPAGIDERIEQVSQDLTLAAQHIAEFKRTHHISDISFDTEKSLTTLSELQLQKAQLQMTLASLDNLTKYLRKNRDGNNSRAEYGAFSDPVFSDQLNQLNLKYEQRKRAGGSASLDQEIEDLKTVIAERLLNTRKKTAVQIESIDQAIASTQAYLSSLPEKANTLQTLERQYQVHQKVYDLLVEKRAQSLVNGTALSTGARILRPATVSATPVAPVVWTVYGIAALAGLLLASVLGYVSEKIRANRITQREEVQTESRIPFIGTITLNPAGSPVTESSIQDLCTRILMRPEAKIITFASTGKGEGKTFIATRFAQALAAMDKKVLLIDMNHLNPEVSDHFDLTPERTMADVLQGTCDIHDAVCITTQPNCDVLVSGSFPSGINSLLASAQREHMFADLKKHYDFIVMDTPETGMVIDAIPMMAWSDLTLYVVRANTTRKQSLQVAEQIRNDYAIDNLFFVLNASKKIHGSVRAAHRRRGNNSIKNIQQQPTTKPSFVPQALRKIALWFY